MAAQRMAEVPTWVHGVSLCTLCFGRNHSRCRRTLCNLTTLALQLQPKGKGPKRKKCLTLSGQTGARLVGRDFSALRAGAGTVE